MIGKEFYYTLKFAWNNLFIKCAPTSFAIATIFYRQSNLGHNILLTILDIHLACGNKLFIVLVELLNFNSIISFKYCVIVLVLLVMKKIECRIAHKIDR